MNSNRSIAELLANWKEFCRQHSNPSPLEFAAGDAEVLAILQAVIDFTTPGSTPTLDLAATLDGPADRPSIALQRTALDDYELIEEIARGGMGIVYRARHLKLDRVVALKTILAGYLASPESVKRFQAEARAAANLSHPNIVPVYEIGEFDGNHYFTMALIEGGSLQVRLNNGPLKPVEAAELLERVARAVHYAHEQGVIHRDLKPQNILLDKDGSPRITDFGLAKRLHDDHQLTATGDVLGTPNYMSPEQITGGSQPVGPHCDVYSLGAVLYCALTGRAPFVGTSLAEIFQQVLHESAVAPRVLSPKIPRDLETICLKCLEKDPSRRYASAQEVASDLQRFSSGQPILARRAGIVEQVWKWSKRRRVVLAAAGIPLVCLLLVVVLLVNYVAVRRRFLESQRYQLTIVADVPGFAEIYDHNDKVVVPYFLLPKLEPIALEPGDYRLSTWATGRQRESLRFFAVPHGENKLTVDFHRMVDWQPIASPTIPAVAQYYFPQRNARFPVESYGYSLLGIPQPVGKHDLLRIRHPHNFSSTKPEDAQMARIDGTTGRTLWSIDTHDDYYPVSEPGDANGDGMQDLVLSNTVHQLAIIDLADGKLTVVHETSFDRSSFNRKPTYQGEEIPPLRQRPPALVAGGNDGGAKKVILQTPPMARAGEPLGNITAVSLADGATLWSRDFEPGNNAKFGTHPACSVLVCAELDKVYAINCQTGNQAWKATLSSEAVCAPLLCDIEGDGSFEVLIVTDIEIYAFKLDDGDSIWQLDPKYGIYLGIADQLSADGAFFVWSENKPNSWGVLIDAKTGRARWSNLLEGVGGAMPLVDVNSDGQIDWLVQMRVRRDTGWATDWSLALMSGADGEILWQIDNKELSPAIGNEARLAPYIHPVVWSDGQKYPTLALSYAGDLKGLALVGSRDGKIIDFRSGRFAGLQAIDLDGDGTTELCGVHQELEANESVTFSWPTQIETWSRHYSNDAEVVGDVNGDGINDLAVGGACLELYSGFDGKLIWAKPEILPVSIARVKNCDMNHDGAADVVLLRQIGDHKREFPSYRIHELTALSGANGDVLWSSHHYVRQGDYSDDKGSDFAVFTREGILKHDFYTHIAGGKFARFSYGIRLDTGETDFRPKTFDTFDVEPRPEPIKKLDSAGGSWFYRDFLIEGQSTYLPSDYRGGESRTLQADRKEMLKEGPVLGITYPAFTATAIYFDREAVAPLMTPISPAVRNSAILREVPWRGWQFDYLLWCGILVAGIVVMPSLVASKVPGFTRLWGIPAAVLIIILSVTLSGGYLYLAIPRDLINQDDLPRVILWKVLVPLILGIPSATYWFVTGRELCRRNLAAAGWLVVAGVVPAVLLGAILVLYDMRWQYYSWSHWYDLLHLNHFVVGFCFLSWHAINGFRRLMG